ncbi:MAG: hypothetical protein N2445_08095, partial [Acidobacteria bacterium]|nr:hypothetical protein [Acidobacteriota bacterium]
MKEKIQELKDTNWRIPRCCFFSNSALNKCWNREWKSEDRFVSSCSDEKLAMTALYFTLKFNPHNRSGYNYFNGNPVNFNDPLGHEENNQPLQQISRQSQPTGLAQPVNQNAETAKQQEQKMIIQPKKVDVEKTIAQLIAKGQVGSFKITSDVQKALRSNENFRKGFEAWLT